LATNTLTQEVVTLPAPTKGDWDIDFDAHKQAFFFCNDGNTVINDTLLFKKSVYVDADGNRKLRDRSGAGSEPTEELFDATLQSFDHADVHVKIGATNVAGAVLVVIRRWAVGGFHVSWDLLQLKTLCGFSQRDGRRTSWIQDRFDAWKRQLATVDLFSGLLRSQPYCDKGAGAFGDRLTPWPSATTGALVHLLCCWIWGDRNHSGFTVPADRARALQFLTALTAQAAEQLKSVGLFLGDVSHRWPRPSTGTWPVKTKVRLEELHLTPLLDKYMRMGRYGEERVEALRGAFPDQENITLIKALQVFTEKPALFLPLLGQLVRAVAANIDASISSSFARGAREVGPSLSISFAALDQSTDYALDNKLYRYKQAFTRFVDTVVPARWSMSVDKSRVYGVGLQSGAIAVENVAWWAPCQDSIASTTAIELHGVGWRW